MKCCWDYSRGSSVWNVGYIVEVVVVSDVGHTKRYDICSQPEILGWIDDRLDSIALSQHYKCFY